MSYGCPLCNGLTTFREACPDCRGTLMDEGRYSDTMGPYSPYRNYDEMDRTNGLIDTSLHLCTHIAKCTDCGSSMPIAIEQIEF